MLPPDEENALFRMIEAGDVDARDVLVSAYRSMAEEKVREALVGSGVEQPADAEVSAIAADALGRSCTRSSEMFRYHLLVDWWARKLVQVRMEDVAKASARTERLQRSAERKARRKRPPQSAE